MSRVQCTRDCWGWRDGIKSIEVYASWCASERRMLECVGYDFSSRHINISSSSTLKVHVFSAVSGIPCYSPFGFVKTLLILLCVFQSFLLRDPYVYSRQLEKLSTTLFMLSFRELCFSCIFEPYGRLYVRERLVV